LIKPNGYLGFIIPSGWVSTPSSRKLRNLFASRFRPESFVSLPYDVFAGAYIDTLIVTARKVERDPGWDGKSDSALNLIVFPVKFKVKGLQDFDRFKKIGSFKDWRKDETIGFLVTASREESNLVSKVKRQTRQFGNVVDVMRGIETFDPRPARAMKHPVRAFNGEMRRYTLSLGEEAFEDYTKEIEMAKPMRFFSGPRLLLRQLVSRQFRLQAVYTGETFLTNQSVQSLLLKSDCNVSLLAVLAVLNSRLLSWYFCQINMVARRDDFPKTIIKQTRELPFPAVLDASIQERLGQLVGQMLEAKKQLAVAQSDRDKDFYENKCDALDRQIDALVYELYGLTRDEIKIVEGIGDGH
jgi:hypothetical protein